MEQSTHALSNLGLWIEKRPAAVVEEALWIVHNRLHDLRPVQALQALRVADVARADNTGSHTS